MLRILLLSCLLLSACKKKDEAKPVEPTVVEKKVNAPEAPKLPATEPGKVAEPSKPAAVKISNAAEYDTKATDLTDKIIGVFVAGGTDCDKLAADLTKLIDEQGGLFAGLKDFEAANPEAKKAFDDKMKPKEKEYEEKIRPSFMACEKHQGLTAAIAKLPLN